MTSEDKDRTSSRSLNNNQYINDTIHKVQLYIILSFIVFIHKVEILVVFDKICIFMWKTGL